MDDFGFVFEPDSEADRTDHWWARYLTYRSETVFVRVELDDRDSAFNVLVGPLVDGEIPDYPIFLPASAEGVEWFPLWALIELRGAELPPFSFDEARLNAELQAWAEALRTHAAPALEGDFSTLEGVYDVLRGNFQRRMREYDG